jgi:hypothetical protein
VVNDTYNQTCTRTARLPNEPQYDRALSIIHQRVKEDIEWWEIYGDKNSSDKKGFRVFPAQLTNCIKVIEKDISDTGAEGYFTFDSKSIKPNYFPMIIDKSYFFMDDIVIALLLTHEMTHVQQYIDSINGKSKLSCVDKEVEAFMAQLDFYVILNMGEESSIYNRIHGEEDLSPQLAIIDTMTTINRESGCGLEGDDLGTKCRVDNLRKQLETMIAEDDFYMKQCSN